MKSGYIHRPYQRREYEHHFFSCLNRNLCRRLASLLAFKIRFRITNDSMPVSKMEYRSFSTSLLGYYLSRFWVYKIFLVFHFDTNSIKWEFFHS